MPKRFNNKIVLITGGSSGIGHATALAFAQEVAKVVVADVVDNRDKETVKTIKDKSREVAFIKTDISKPTDVENMVKTTVETYGRIDILFNNAGIAGFPVRLAELSVKDWDRVIDINLKGVFLGSKYTIPVMLEQGKGVIINNASSSGITPIPRVSVYAAAKAGVIQLTKAMAIEYGGDNIRVNCICPGFIETPMTSIIIPPDSESRDYSHLWPLTKPGNPEDIAKAALYLASDDSSFVTGTSLVVDGGWLAGTRLPLPRGS
ncbi:MAG TPA: glucose 1-dehydrogenase [Dehalococcoidia bacterium]|nr:glucose 1-dehydrogenase [Dehalococcoidia bacterium]